MNRNGIGVLTAGFVVVGDDDDVSTMEKGGMLRLPLACASGVARGGNADLREIIDVLFAFDDSNDLL